MGSMFTWRDSSYSGRADRMATSLYHIDPKGDETAMLAHRSHLQDSHGFAGGIAS